MSPSAEIYFHVNPRELTFGECLPRGSYGREMAKHGFSLTMDHVQEYLREDIRQSHYSDKPSRLSSSFVFETFADAASFRNNFREGWYVYQVRFCKTPTVVHRVCYTAWDENCLNHTIQAHDFWRNPALYSSNTELFAEEDLVVLQRCNINEPPC